VADLSEKWRSWAPERLRDFLDRRQLEAEIEKIDAKFQPLLDAADASQEPHVHQAWNYETDELQEELARLSGKRLEKQARRWNVDIPEECWTESRFSGYRFIGFGGRAKLGRAIRDARRESVRWWVQVLIMPLIALLSLMITFVTLVSRK
jgi:hypothetical protein